MRILGARDQIRYDKRSGNKLTKGVEDVPSIEVILFLVVALLAGGLTMGGVTLVYFLDKWRKEPQPRPVSVGREVSPFDRAA